MMRSKYQSAKANSESEVNILPLIDVLFAILLFFMLSSIVLTEKNQIAVQRPTNLASRASWQSQENYNNYPEK